MSVTPDDALDRSNESGGLFRKVPYLLVAFLLTAVIIVPFLAILGYEAFYMYRIHNGVSVGGVSLGGMTLEEARVALAGEFETYAERDITLDYQGRLWFATARELGVTYDPRLTSERAYRVGREGAFADKLQAQVEALFYGHPVPAVQSFDEGAATMYLSRLAREINQPARDARFKVDGLQVSTEPGRTGLELDMAGTQSALKAALGNLSGAPVEMVVRRIEPVPMEMETARRQAANLLSGPLFSRCGSRPSSAAQWPLNGSRSAGHWGRRTWQSDGYPADQDAGWEHCPGDGTQRRQAATLSREAGGAG